MSFPLIRLVTIHPALVHLPLGIAAFAIVAFCAAAARRSERWAFSADLALGAAALGALAAAAFGFIAFFTLRWPGGFDAWPQLHLGFGVASTVLLIALAAWRARERKSGRTSVRWGEATAMVLVGAVLGFTGWIGGDVLVFRSGMAVTAAGDGALAPALAASAPPAPETGDVRRTMGQVRGAFAAIETDLAGAIANGREPGLWHQVDTSAARLQQLSHWLQQQPSSDFRRFAGQLSHHAEQLRDAAAAQRLPQVVAAAGSLEQTCAECHEHLRWNETP